MATGKLEYKKVIALTHPHQDHLLKLKIEGERVAIEATPSHPFWVRRTGKAAVWITAGRMHAGDLVLTEKGKWEQVTEDVPLNKLATVYNFEVQDDHDYFVGSTGVLVHNAGPCGPLDWSRTNPNGQTAVDHVNMHGIDDPSKYAHGVFADDPITSTNQAWDTAVQNAIEPTVGSNGNWNYDIPYPDAGLAGGISGSAAGNPILNMIRIVTLPFSNTVVTAFPF